jgi:hypothetical protein
MAITWENISKLLIELDYRVSKETADGPKNLAGTIQFDLGCYKLDDSKPQKNVREVKIAILKKCMPLLEELKKKHGLNVDETSNMIATVLLEERVDADSIESDAQRKQKAVSGWHHKKEYFNKSRI